MPSPSQCVEAIAPLMHALLPGAGGAAHACTSAFGDAHYTRNAILVGEQLSLYAIVWQPGQWTPVHDHGSWGVVGVIEGALHERAWLRTSPTTAATRHHASCPAACWSSVPAA